MNTLVHDIELEPTKIAHLIDEDEFSGDILITDEDTDNTPSSIEVSALNSAADFIKYARAASKSIPQYSKVSTNSIRRAFAYIDQLRDELIKTASDDAAYSDLTQQDLQQLDQIEQTLEAQAIELHTAFKSAEKKYQELTEQLKQSKVDHKGLQKVAWKASGDSFFYDSFHFSIARLLINAKVANAKNVNVLYGNLAQKYGMDERDKLSILFAMRDMGYPVTNSLIDGDDLLQRYFN